MRRNWSFGVCRHEHTIVTLTAGLAHQVCEACGHVSLRFVASAVSTEPMQSRTGEPREPMEARPTADSLGTRCRLCSQQAVFIIPEGMVCDEHAWQAAARLRWDESEPWVPIRIDRARA